MMTNRLAIALVLFAVACTDAGEPASSADAGPVSGDPQLAPQGHAALTTWLQEGHYLAWACEDAPHPARPPGAHGTNRICSNAALSGSTDGDYPIGAVSVKELYRNGSINGHAVGRKVAGGTAASSWYWYENIGGSVVADSIGAGLCAGCHEDAPRDYIFTRVE